MTVHRMSADQMKFSEVLTSIQNNKLNMMLVFAPPRVLRRQRPGVRISSGAPVTQMLDGLLITL
jgi:hypothetical protein